VIERTMLLADKPVLEANDFEFLELDADGRPTTAGSPVLLADIIRLAVRAALDSWRRQQERGGAAAWHLAPAPHASARWRRRGDR
jgi:hypothetical protein